MIESIKPEEIVSLSESPYELFDKSVTRPKTKTRYTGGLKMLVCGYFSDILHGDPQKIQQQKERYARIGKKLHYKKNYDADFEDRVNEFVLKAKKDPEWAESLLLTVITKLMDRAKKKTSNKQHLQSTSIPNIINPVKKLFEMNSIVVSWSRIQNPITDEYDVRDDTKGYTLSQVQLIRKFCDPMEDLIIVLGACSGIRAEGYMLEWGHIYPVYNVDNNFL